MKGPKNYVFVDNNPPESLGQEFPKYTWYKFWDGYLLS